MLYLIGLGLSHDSISKKGLEIAKKCKKVYLENYTVELPYSNGAIEETIGKKVVPADREFVESLEIIDEAVRSDVALLIYGSPLMATTHMTLLEEARKSGVKAEVVYNASIFDAIAETGLQLYKFGKIASMPNFEADSYIEIVKANLDIKAHTLILIDIGMDFNTALDKLAKNCFKFIVKLNKIVVCSRLGTGGSRIYYGVMDSLRSLEIRAPFCIIIPSELHFMEKEVLEGFKK